MLRKNSQQETIRYWQKIEEEIGEEIIGKEMCEYRGGLIDIEPRTWGLIYYTESSIYFHAFPKKSFWSSLLGGSQREYSGEVRRFQIRWDSIKEVKLPSSEKSFLSKLLLPDYQVSIKFQRDSIEKTLILLIYSRSTQENIVACFQKYHPEPQSITN
jgi:hypothetical protein